MLSFWNAIRFLWNIQKKNLILRFSEIQITTDLGPVSADLYVPKGKRKGTIVTVNGLAPLGPKDPRFQKLSQALAQCGYRVVSPHLKEICDFKISKQNVDEVGSFLDALVKHEEFSEETTFGIFAPSFSAGLCLISLSDKDRSHIYSSVCTIGSYSKLEELIPYLFESQKTDEYGRLILLWNFCQYVWKEKMNLREQIRLAILDNYFKNNEGPSLDWKKNLTEEEVVLWEKIQTSPSFRMKLWQEILDNAGETKELLHILNVTKRLKPLVCSVTLVHGIGDDVVPSTQSQAIYDTLQKFKTDVKLCFTSLISHGDTGFKWSQILDVFPLVGSFAFFFSRLQKRLPIQAK